MKNFTLLLLFTALILSACKKDSDVQPKTNINTPVTKTPGKNTYKNLRLDSIKRAYYNNDGNRYETNMFRTDSTEFNYNIIVEKDKKYRVLLYGIYAENITLELYRNGSVIQTGVQANVGLTAKYFVYTGGAQDTLQIKLKTSDPTLYNQPFFLTFEEINTYTIYWKGHQWLCDGDWEVSTSQQLVFKGYHSGFSKWIKLADSSLTDYSAKISFTSTGTLTNFIGIAANASDSIFDMINLPAIGSQFKIDQQNNWELWSIAMGNGEGIGRQTGNFTDNIKSGGNTIGCTIDANNNAFFVNNTLISTASKYTGNTNAFYITVEDVIAETQLMDDIRFY